MMNKVQVAPVMPLAAPKGTGTMDSTWPGPQDFAALMKQVAAVPVDEGGADLAPKASLVEPGSTTNLQNRPALRSAGHHHFCETTAVPVIAADLSLEIGPETVPQEALLLASWSTPPDDSTLTFGDPKAVELPQPLISPPVLPQALPLVSSNASSTRMDDVWAQEATVVAPHANALPHAALLLSAKDQRAAPLSEKSERFPKGFSPPAQELPQASPILAPAGLPDASHRTSLPTPTASVSPKPTIIQPINQASDKTDVPESKTGLAKTFSIQQFPTAASNTHSPSQTGNKTATISLVLPSSNHAVRRADRLLIDDAAVAPDQMALHVDQPNSTPNASPANPTVKGQAIPLSAARRTDSLADAPPNARHTPRTSQSGGIPPSTSQDTSFLEPSVATPNSLAVALPKSDVTVLSNQPNPLLTALRLTTVPKAMATSHGFLSAKQALSRFQHMLDSGIPGEKAQTKIATSFQTNAPAVHQVEGGSKPIQTANTSPPSALLPTFVLHAVEASPAILHDFTPANIAVPPAIALPTAQASEPLLVVQRQSSALPEPSPLLVATSANPAALSAVTITLPSALTPLAANLDTTPTTPSAVGLPLETKRLFTRPPFASTITSAPNSQPESAAPQLTPIVDQPIAAVPVHEPTSAKLQPDTVQPLPSDTPQPLPIICMPSAALPHPSTAAALDCLSHVLPKSFPAALAHSVTASGHARAELILEPVELGRMRFEFVTQGDRVQINLTAERLETLDLLRRHAEELRQEFRASGLDTGTLNFSQWGQPAKHQPRSEFADATDLPLPPQPVPLAAPQARANGAGLDLRL